MSSVRCASRGGCGEVERGGTRAFHGTVQVTSHMQQAACVHEQTVAGRSFSKTDPNCLPRERTEKEGCGQIPNTNGLLLHASRWHATTLYEGNDGYDGDYFSGNAM